MDRTATRQYYQDNVAARRIALLIVAIGSFLVPLALAASIVAIPTIAADLNASAVLVSGIPTVYVLGQMAASVFLFLAALCLCCPRCYQASPARLKPCYSTGYYRASPPA